jgi:hypothetical protein
MCSPSRSLSYAKRSRSQEFKYFFNDFINPTAYEEGFEIISELKN